MVRSTVRRDHLPLEWNALLAAAMDAQRRAYAPYSRFAVGAAVRTATGRIFAGCNVENVSFGLTVCAERVAIWKAVSSGEQVITHLALVTEPGVTPCGACRQVMQEFALGSAQDLAVLVSNGEGVTWLTSLADLLPLPFSDADLCEPLVEAQGSV
jgi:cytidine deaminase